ncbi:hypothetical protein ACN469_36250 [Corallococcus terminator]
MKNVTESAAALYTAMQQLLEDLNKLGQDFQLALRDEGQDFPTLEEYSWSPNALVLKKNHTWMCYQRPEDTPETGMLTFAACMVYLQAEKHRWKLSAANLPELWFFLGTVSPPPDIKWPSTIPSFFDKKELQHYETVPVLGGTDSYYQYIRPESTWRAVCLGFSLGDIDSAEKLKLQAVRPLIAAALKRGVIS